MPEDRLEQIFNMVTELIRIAGNTNAAVEELRKGQEELKQGQERLEDRMDGLEVRMDRLEARMDGLEARMDRLETRTDSIETIARHIQEDQKSMFEVMGEHEVAIRSLRRRPV